MVKTFCSCYNTIGSLIQRIDKSSWEGYIWFTNESAPRRVQGTVTENTFIPIQDPDNSFIHECFLFSGKESIKAFHVDGVFKAFHYDLSLVGSAPLHKGAETLAYPTVHKNVLEANTLLFESIYEDVPSPIDGITERNMICEVFVGMKNT